MHIKRKRNATLCSIPFTVVPLLKTKKPQTDALLCLDLSVFAYSFRSFTLMNAQPHLAKRSKTIQKRITLMLWDCIIYISPIFLKPSKWIPLASIIFKNFLHRVSLVAQWLRVCLPMQGTWVRALVWEDPTCRGAAGPVSHNYWACASGACAPQQERPW